MKRYMDGSKLFREKKEGWKGMMCMGVRHRGMEEECCWVRREPSVKETGRKEGSWVDGVRVE